MPKPVDSDGVVSGPAPQGFTSAGTPQQRAVSVLQKDLPDCSVYPTPDQLQLALAEATRNLSDARISHLQCERVLDNLCTQIMIGGERIPALDQPKVSVVQEAYLNASTAAVVTAENIIILQDQVSRLECALADVRPKAA